jgi:hypothetical protein
VPQETNYVFECPRKLKSESNIAGCNFQKKKKKELGMCVSVSTLLLWVSGKGSEWDQN